MRGLKLAKVMSTISVRVISKMKTKMRLAVGVITTLFLGRCVLFLISAVPDVKISATVCKETFPWLFYALPEILPGIVVLMLMLPGVTPVKRLGDDNMTCGDYCLGIIGKGDGAETHLLDDNWEEPYSTL